MTHIDADNVAGRAAMRRVRGKSMKRRYGSISVAELEQYVALHFATKKEFAIWVGVSPEALLGWCNRAEIPRSIEIIVRNERPPPRKSPSERYTDMEMYVPSPRKVTQVD
jgi:hypothetical protein